MADTLDGIVHEDLDIACGGGTPLGTMVERMALSGPSADKVRDAFLRRITEGNYSLGRLNDFFSARLANNPRLFKVVTGVNSAAEAARQHIDQIMHHGF